MSVVSAVPKMKKSKKTSETSKTVVNDELTSSTSVTMEPTVVPDISKMTSVADETVSSKEVDSVSNVVDDETSSEESSIEILFNKLVNQFQDIQLVMKTLQSNLKVLQKEVLRDRKESKKKSDKKNNKKNSDKKRAPSGFAKPGPISDDLANFLGMPSGSQLARTDVTTKVITYVKEFNLQNPENKKQILCDAKLKSILEPGDNVITFFNLQTYLKKHFLQPTDAVTVI